MNASRCRVRRRKIEWNRVVEESAARRFLKRSLAGDPAHLDRRRLERFDSRTPSKEQHSPNLRKCLTRRHRGMALRSLCRSSQSQTALEVLVNPATLVWAYRSDASDKSKAVVSAGCRRTLVLRKRARARPSRFREVGRDPTSARLRRSPRIRQRAFSSSGRLARKNPDRLEVFARDT